MDDKDKDEGDKGEATSGTVKSTLGGALAGAVAGSVLGAPVVGTVLGAVSGAAIGAAKKRTRRTKPAPAAKRRRSPETSAAKKRSAAATKRPEKRRLRSRRVRIEGLRVNRGELHHKRGGGSQRAHCEVRRLYARPLGAALQMKCKKRKPPGFYVRGIPTLLFDLSNFGSMGKLHACMSSLRYDAPNVNGNHTSNASPLRHRSVRALSDAALFSKLLISSHR